MLWPFSNLRISWNNIAIIDPIFTGALLIGVICTFVIRRKQPARLALGFGILYLLFGVYQREGAENFLKIVAQARGHQVMRLEAKPTVLNLILWRGIYESEKTFYIQAIRVGLFSSPKLYEGGKIQKFTPEKVYPDLLENSQQYLDIQRFTYFSQGWVALHPNINHSVGDVRYGLLPQDVTPLWGIKINPLTPDSHVENQNFRIF